MERCSHSSPLRQQCLGVIHCAQKPPFCLQLPLKEVEPPELGAGEGASKWLLSPQTRPEWSQGTTHRPGLCHREDSRLSRPRTRSPGSRHQVSSPNPKPSHPPSQSPKPLTPPPGSAGPDPTDSPTWTPPLTPLLRQRGTPEQEHWL